MEKIQIIESPKGTFSCQLDITVEEWETILQDKTITTQNYKDALLSFFGEPAHKATCSDLGMKYYGQAKDGAKFNSWITHFGQAVVKKLNRFHILGNDGSERFWHVAIDPGTTLPNGTFEWTLRPELVQAIKNLGWGGRFSWIPFYTEFADKLLVFKDDRQALLDIVYALDNKFVKYISGEEGVRVADVDPFTVIGIFNRGLKSQNRVDIAEYFKNALGIEAALPNDFDGIPVVSLLKANFFYRDKVNEDVHTLWDVFEAALTGDKAKLAASMNEALSHHGVKWNLTMGLYWIRPNDYIALDENTRNYLPQIGINVFKEKDLNAENYLALLENVKQAIAQRTIKEASIPDVSYNAWFSRYQATENAVINAPLIPQEKTMIDPKLKEYISLLEENHNLVLTGAPGTGKTFLAKQIAKAMGADENLKNFVQFHPSYDYTDFVEGLRPSREGDGFERRDGVFKAFCKHVIMSHLRADNNIFEGINDEPTIWKVSLEGTGDNPTRTDCMKNDHIRIGWSEYGDVEDFSEYGNFYNGGTNILPAFQNAMKIGDIVVSCYGSYQTDAIGIITGDYEYREEGGNLPRYRDVKWLIKGVNLDTHDLIGKRMMQPTVYRLGIPLQKLMDFVKQHHKHNTQPLSESKQKHVFIIDEINRGDLSKIFGELFFSIDPGYRGKEGLVQTQYQNMIDPADVFAEGFYIPENVYIIATMNDIDRSVESMDFAMRRRFTWVEVTPEDRMDMLEQLPQKEEAIRRMQSLNKAIEATEGLGAAFQIGPAYFLKLKNGDFQRLWRLNIEPLLKEYLRGFRKAEETLQKFEKAYNLAEG